VVLGRVSVSYERDTPVMSWGYVSGGGRGVGFGVQRWSRLRTRTQVNCGESYISHEVFITSFCKSPFSHKSVNVFFILVTVKDDLTDLWGS